MTTPVNDANEPADPDPRQAVWEARRRALEERVRQVNRWCSARGGKIPTGEGPFSRVDAVIARVEAEAATPPPLAEVRESDLTEKERPAVREARSARVPRRWGGRGRRPR